MYIISYTYVKHVKQYGNLHQIFNNITTMNCTINVAFFVLSNADKLSDLINHPFRTAFWVILGSGLWSWVGYIISNLSPYSSNIIFNSLLTFANIQLFKSVRNNLSKIFLFLMMHYIMVKM